MKTPDAPKLETRRAADFERELLTHARTWIPSWSLDEGEADFGRALVKIAARFNSEVAERLDNAGKKMALGFLDWLGMPALAARPARMPVVLKMAETAREPVLALRPVKMQVDVEDTTITFETENDLQVIPGQLAAVVGVDPITDSYYLPPPGLTSLAPAEPLPTAWKLKNFAAPASEKLQLDPGIGLTEDMLVEIKGEQYRIVDAKDDLVRIHPKVPGGDGFASGTRVSKVESFRPFGDARNLQEHILYIGDSDLLNIEAKAHIEIIGLHAVPDGLEWEYWGKSDPEDPVDADPRWRKLKAIPLPAGETLIVEKPAGAIEAASAPAEGRWIRARLVTSDRMIETDSITLRVNPQEPGQLLSEKVEKDDWATLLRPEVFVNSTSSPTDSFYPLGREPRMFDTLYLGSAEAFSKAGAEACARFELGDSTFKALAALRQGPLADRVVVGAGQDGALRVFAFDPLTGSLTRYRGLEAMAGKANGSDTPIPLDFKSDWPLPIWTDSTPDGVTFHVAVWSGGNVLIWDETGVEAGNWRPWGTVESKAQKPDSIAGLIYLPAGALETEAVLVALRDGRVWRTPVANAAQWAQIDTTDGVDQIDFATLTPIFDANAADFLGTADLGLIGISREKMLYHIDIGDGVCTKLASDSFDPAIRPAAALDGTLDFAIVGCEDGSGHLIALDSTSTPLILVPAPPVAAVSVCYAAGTLHFMAAINAQPTTLIDLPRPDGGAFAEPFETELPASLGIANGAPLILNSNILIPAAEAEVFVAGFDLANRIVRETDLLPGVILPVADSPLLITGDTVAFVGSVTVSPIKSLIIGNGITSGGQILYPLDQPLPSNGSLPVAVYSTSGVALSGTVDIAANEFKLASSTGIQKNTWLLIDGTFRRVVDFVDPTAKPDVITVDPAFVSGDPTTGDYFLPASTAGEPASFLRLDPLTTGNWDARLLQRTAIEFPDLALEQQGKAFTTGAGNRPGIVLLDAPLLPQPTNPVTFIIDAAAGEWRRTLGDTSTNPELAWEYWDGASWVRLPGIVDRTNNLRNSGTLSFTVPNDIKPGEWAGKTNHWIRARLIGGDYGKENVSVVSKPGPGEDETTQTVRRTTEGLAPPYALHVGVAYAVTNAAIPQLLLTQDSGTTRDQSDANRTPGAQVEIFVPLSTTLDRLDASMIQASLTDACVPDCECDTGTSSVSPSPAAASAPASTVPSTASGSGRRAIYLGFTSKLLGQPVNVLFNVAQESDYDAIGPLRVDALIGDRFAPIVATDETRALGETGLLKMAFDVAPLKAELFGRALSWIRIAPRVGSADWKPSIAGVYPNGVWTRAAETMTRELLGSSDGQPSLTVTLARPPLLQGSLELRVREPLGDEELAALREDDPNFVKSAVTDLPGHWVLWKQVADPTDCGPSDRVYSLDETSGTVRFGDGLHGMIPPVGVDAVVAFSYERTEPPAGDRIAANFITQRTELNLVSPLETVETVIAGDASAGGVGAQSSDRVLQFAPAALRHRGRAVSLRDFEDLILQNYDDVAQARALRSNGRIRLVVVTRAASPLPTRAQQREMRRMLLEIAPAALGVANAFSIAGARLRRLRIALNLRVRDLDVGGQVASEAKTRLAAGFEHGNWPLGRTPGEADLAEALLGIPGLDGIVSVDLFEIDEISGARPLRRTVEPDELVILAPEDVQVGFEVMEVQA